MIPPALRRALNARDHGCRWPGWERPGTYCDSHHLLHWIRGGKTELDNLALICFRHHQLLHDGGWEAHLAEDGRLVVIPPSARSFKYPRGPDGLIA